MSVEIKYIVKIKGLNLEIGEEEARAIFTKLKSHFEPPPSPQYYYPYTISNVPNTPFAINCSTSIKEYSNE